MISCGIWSRSSRAWARNCRCAKRMATNHFRAPDLIATKRDGKGLSNEQIKWFVQAVTRSKQSGVEKIEVEDSQIGAILMAIYLKGMSPNETTSLTQAMKYSGEVLEWPKEWRLVDKHSTGGVGDKVSLPLAPALAACGFKVPMISGRGLGHTGGTLDKMESISGYNVFLDRKGMHTVLDRVGCCIVGQTGSLVPADKILYATRDVTSTVESIPLITASIISKKAAESISALVLDVKYGKGAFMKTKKLADELAKSLISSGEGNGIRTVALLTDMSSPIGYTIGNALEVHESLECLKGRGPKDLNNLVCKLGAQLLLVHGVSSSDEDAEKMIGEVLQNGTALEKFQNMLIEQGVRKEEAQVLCSKEDDRVWEILKKANNTKTLTVDSSGYVQDINAEELAKVSLELGAGRKKASEAVDHSVGIELFVTIGCQLQKGDEWVKVHFSESHLSEKHEHRIQASLIVANHPAESTRVTAIVKKQQDGVIVTKDL